MNGCSEIKMSYVPKVLRKSRDPRKALSFSHHPAVTPSCQLPDHKPWADPILAPGTRLAQGLTLGGNTLLPATIPQELISTRPMCISGPVHLTSKSIPCRIPSCPATKTPPYTWRCAGGLGVLGQRGTDGSPRSAPCHHWSVRNPQSVLPALSFAYKSAYRANSPGGFSGPYAVLQSWPWDGQRKVGACAFQSQVSAR